MQHFRVQRIRAGGKLYGTGSCDSDNLGWLRAEASGDCGSDHGRRNDERSFRKLGSCSIDVGWDEMELYDCYAVTGTSAEVNGAFTGYILCTPDELEYLIDCMSGDTPVKRDNEYVSTVWTAASGLDSLLNKDSSDQAKTADNSWGLTTDPSGLNTWAYDQGTTTPLYSYGYWANGGVAISYDLTLPAGKHVVMLGGYDFWSGRNMDVYYSVDGGEKELLCELAVNHDTGSMAQGTITLTEDAVVTISVENGGRRRSGTGMDFC